MMKSQEQMMSYLDNTIADQLEAAVKAAEQGDEKAYDMRMLIDKSSRPSQLQ